MKYTDKQWQELADKVALVAQLTADIEKAKVDIRQMTKEETNNKYVAVKRTNDTRTTYPENYKTELAIVKQKLSAKYAEEIVVTTKENYKIELNPMKQSQQKVETITSNVLQMSNTKLKRALASQTKR